MDRAEQGFDRRRLALGPGLTATNPLGSSAMAKLRPTAGIHRDAASPAASAADSPHRRVCGTAGAT